MASLRCPGSRLLQLIALTFACSMPAWGANELIDHETGDLSEYDSVVTDGGDLSVTSTAALGGTSRGMQVAINDTNPIYATKNCPATQTLRVRAYLDPNGLTMADGDLLRILMSGTGVNSVFKVQLYRTGGQYQIRGQLRNDGGGNEDTAWVTISDAEHWIEFEVDCAASAGYFRLWVDDNTGAPDAEITGVDNDTRTISDIIVGARGIDATTTGTIYLDEISYNSTGNPIGPGRFVVTNTNNAGAGSLRQAILDANANSAADTIVFDIASATNASLGADAWWRISPTSALPALTDDSTTIDGRTQTTNQGDTNALGPEIEISGTSAGAVDGFVLQSAGNEIRGLAIIKFMQDGIDITGAGATANKVYGNHIGADATGTVNVRNDDSGINVDGANAIIGGVYSGEGNLIAYNWERGIRLTANGSGTQITGNEIREQGYSGIVSGAANVVISKNLIRNNSTRQPWDEVALSTGNKLYHNTIHGSPGGDGVSVEGANAVIRNNIITGNAGYGIRIDGGSIATESDNLIPDNVINPPAIRNGAGRSTIGLDASDLNVDPQYTDLGGNDFSLQPLSPAINDGIDLGVDQPDMNGGLPGNYNGPLPDMGAFESTGVDYVWDGNSDGDGDGASWSDPLNWTADSGYPDDALDTATIAQTGNNITTPGVLTIGALTMDDPFTGSVSLAGTLTIDDGSGRSGALTLNGAVGAYSLTTTGANHGLNVEGTVSITGGNLNANGSTVTIYDDWTMANTAGLFTAGTSTVVLADDGSIDSLSFSNGFFNLTQNNGVVTEVATFQVNNGAFTTGGPGSEIKADGASGVINFLGTATLVNNNPTWGGGTAALSLRPAAGNFPGGDYGDCEFWHRFGGTITQTGAVTTSGTFFIGNATISIWDTNGHDFTAGSIRIGTFWDNTADGRLLIRGASKVTAQTFLILEAADNPGDNSLVVDAGGTNTIAIGTNLTVSANGTIDAQQSSFLFEPGSAGTFTITSNGQSLHHLTLDDAGSGATLELQDALDVNGNLTLTSGTLDAKSGGNYPINVGGNWDKNGGTFDSRSNLVTFDGSGVVTLDSGGTDPGSDFNTLTFNKSGGGSVQIVTSDLDVDGGITISAGTVDVNGRAVTGAITMNGGALVGTGTVGAITANGGMVQPGNTADGILNAASADFSGGWHAPCRRGCLHHSRHRL